MKYRILKVEDTAKYSKDLLDCYTTNHLVLDNQSPINLSTEELVKEFVDGFITANDSYVLGIYDDNEKYLYGIVIFDNIRIGKKSCAQVHIVNSKDIFGLKVRNIYRDIIKGCPIDTLYVEIPTIAVHAISICKKLGFKKTGYIPNALPYTNSLGEEKMYDLQIYCLER